MPEIPLCQHFTPEKLVDTFAQTVEESILEKVNGSKNRICIGDLFCGDGRLGRAVEKRLCKSYKLSLTYADIDESLLHKLHAGHSRATVLSRDIIRRPFLEKFDVVVANPPYARVASHQIDAIGLKMDEIRQAGWNLYGIGIMRAIAACKPGGLSFIVCPFGWLHGSTFTALRWAVSDTATEITAIGLNSRKVFPDVFQDIAIHIIKKKVEPRDGSIFTFRHLNPRKAGVPKITALTQVARYVSRIRIGPIVWNRRIDDLGQKGSRSIPLIYGRNLRDEGIVFPADGIPARRQYIKEASLRPGEIVQAPAILIRRVLLGSPGQWKPVVTAMPKRQGPIVAENHVIIIELSDKRIGVKALRQFADDLRSSIARATNANAHANLSVSLIKEILHL